MKWFYKLNRKNRILITLGAWILFYAISLIDNPSGLLSFLFVTVFVLSIVFTVCASKATKRERLLKKEKEKILESAKAVSFTVQFNSGRETGRFPIKTKVKGVTFEGRQKFLEESNDDDDLIIKHSPTDAYPDTISVKNTRTGKILGNIGSDLAKSLLERYGDGCCFYGNITEITGGGYDRSLGCNIVINGIRDKIKAA